MSLIHYRIILKLLSPLHIGKQKYRNLMTTREYVPGRTLWGALTARITRGYFGTTSEEYEKIGSFLIENFRFGYLWPAIKEENQIFEVYFPWESDKIEEDQGLKYKFISADKFDYLFKAGYMSQAGDYTTKSSDEGELHEVEFISPKTRYNQDVYLVGDMWIKEAVGNIPSKIKAFGKTINLCRVFDSIQLGGEKGYGWGRIGVEDIRKIESNRALSGVKVEIKNNDVILSFEKGSRITAHAIPAMMPEGFLTGEIEPLLGYEFKGEWRLSTPLICYAPASSIKNEVWFKVGLFGLLEKAD